MEGIGQSIVSNPFQGLAERRFSARFPVEQEIRYRLVQSRTGSKNLVGKTLNISSGGVLFTTSEPLPPGHLVEMAIHWPVRLDGTCPLQFVATGRVVRSEAAYAAVRIQRYEFRTRGAGSISAAAAIV